MNWIPVIIACSVLGGVGIVFGIVLTIADKKFAVQTDSRVDSIISVLGGANCGACGYSGCAAFAQAVVAGEAPADGCPVAGKSATQAIARIMGVEVRERERMVARVICGGCKGVAAERYEYDGYPSCSAAVSLAGGPKLCASACVGLGDCVEICPLHCISIKEGIANVDEACCVGCGKCVQACPRHVIELVPASAKVSVMCRNTEPGRVARQQCMKSCIACGRCVKTCRYDAIEVKDNCARIDYQKCTRCGECAAVCPTGCIVDFSK